MLITSIPCSLSRIIHNASHLDVNDERSFNRMTNLYAESKEWEKKIDRIRKEANAPDQAAIAQRNERAKEILEPLREIQEIAKKKSDQYMKILEAKRKQEILEETELFGVEEASMVPALEKSVGGERAVAYTRTVRKFRIVDISQVPSSYLQINEDLVERDIKLGVSEIPGIDIYEENVTQLRTR